MNDISPASAIVKPNLDSGSNAFAPLDSYRTAKPISDPLFGTARITQKYVIAKRILRGSLTGGRKLGGIPEWQSKIGDPDGTKSCCTSGVVL